MRLPRNVSGRDLAKALERYGYAVDRQVGSHIRLTTQQNGEHHVTIPDHNPMRIGTLSQVIGDVAAHLGRKKTDVQEELFS